MKLKEGFMLRQVAGSWVVVPAGRACVDFDGMISLNDSGALLWRTLEQGGGRAELIAALTDTDEVDPVQAEQDMDEFLDILRQANCLSE